MTKGDAIKQAEDRGYSKGYAAGKRRKAMETRADRDRARENALWQRFMLAALPFAMTQDTWSRGGQPIKSTVDRVILAGNVADAAVAETLKRRRL